MKVELDEMLVKKYPKIFAQRGLSMKTTAMCWGFDCGDGWLFLIDQLCDRIQRHCDKMGIQIEATQVKEKFGGLRFYTDTFDEIIEAYLREAEEDSFRICEVCGTREGVKVYGQGWVHTRCKRCEEEKK